MVQSINKATASKARGPEFLSTDHVGERLSPQAGFPTLHASKLPSEISLSSRSEDFRIAKLAKDQISNPSDNTQNHVSEKQETAKARKPLKMTKKEASDFIANPQNAMDDENKYRKALRILNRP